MFNEVFDVINPVTQLAAVSPQDQLIYSARLAKETAKTTLDGIKSSAEKAAQLSRWGKLGKAAWMSVFTLYTFADDIPAGAFYSAVEEAKGRPKAIAALGLGSTLLAGVLSKIQRRRIETDAKNESELLIEKNRSLGTDLLSTFAIGSPATVATYPRHTIPSMWRTRAMSAFYGFGAQAGAYAGVEFGAEAVGIDPKLALATAISGVVAYRYAKDTTDDFGAISRVMAIDNEGFIPEAHDHKFYYPESKAANF